MVVVLSLTELRIVSNLHLRSEGASGGVREDELQFLLSAAFLDLWRVQNPSGSSQKITNPALECT